MNSCRILLVAALGVLAACSDSTGTSGMSGTMSFNYSGAITGSFSATGGIPLGDPNASEWAVGGRDDQEGLIAVFALNPQSGGTYDNVFVLIPRLTAGSSTIDISCSTNCAIVGFEAGASDNTEVAAQSCFLESGTITLTSVSSSRAQGTFSGTGTCISAQDVENPFTISGGTFNVALIAGLEP